jgi:acyl-CoA synthetase (AMP-forming)/AMP-acid ligase II
VIHCSPFSPVDIPDTPLTAFVLAGAAARGRRPALVDSTTGRTITYGELTGMVDRAAAGLAQLGIGKGDVCAMFSANTVDYLIAVLAIARLGAIVTTANPLNTTDDVARQLADSHARLLITSATLASTWRGAVDRSEVEHVITLNEWSGSSTPDPTTTTAGNMAFSDLLARPGTPPAVTIDPDGVVALPYSSGTTGLPKGVMLTHRNLVANMIQLDAVSHYRHDEDTTVAFLPFFHIYGLTVIGLLGLRSGATLIVMARFDLEQYLALVERHRATVLHVVPPVVLALAKHASVSGRDFSSVRKLFSGAAPLGRDVIEQCTRRIGCVLQQGYGLTETSPATHATSDVPERIKYGSIGVPLPNTECRVVNPATSADALTGEDGELWIRGPQVMRGYFNRPDETRATLDADGWLHTGDIGHVDRDGDFFIVDRLKELIKYKGMQVAPAELESVLLSHPAVSDAAVVPLADADCGEIPRAFVVLKAPVTAEELMDYVARRVAPYKKIRRVDFIDAIPKSPSGKILRRLLRDVAVA